MIFSCSSQTLLPSAHGYRPRSYRLAYARMFTLTSRPAHLTHPLLRYIGLYLGSFFALPVTRADGTKLSHEDLVKKLDEVTVGYEADCGITGYFADTVRVAIKAEVSEYETVIGLLRDLLYSPEYAQDRCVCLISIFTHITDTMIASRSTLLRSCSPCLSRNVTVILSCSRFQIR